MIPMTMHHRQVVPGDLLVFGGPYSNLQATRAVRAQAKSLGIPAGNCICTGDVVAYCANPLETIAEIRDWGCQVIAGNVERQLAQGALDCGCGFDEGTTCDRLSAGWYAHANAHVTPEARDWMGTLPDMIRFDHAMGQIFVLHGGATQVNRFLWPSSSGADLRSEIAELQAGDDTIKPACILAGHSGIAFQRMIEGIKWINAGVIGMPPHDGHQATRYAVLQEDGEAEIHHLHYDAEGAASAMEQAGLTQGYHVALLDGHWPSEDILPADLRR
ncbi:metallophosphoesterase family protein [Primorskyibacter sp. 2E233]|uniref:metallophosphoesterase family protein n=1 Tax=Primorskyibacter sp. 2E233 TaxID=3413431 RepID=UPI003BF428F2